MKSAQLVVFLTIASWVVGCGSQESAVNDSGGLVESPLEVAAVGVSVEDSQSLSKASPRAEASARERDSFVSTQKSAFPKSAQINAAQTALADVETAPIAQQSDARTISKAGRDNPFALAEQPDFEVRFLPANAPKPLPPIPDVGLGPEPGASLLPGSPPVVVAPMELRPAVPMVVVPPGQPGMAVAPHSQSAVPPTTIRSPAVAPVALLPQGASSTALAEAVEIKGVVQLGDQIAIIVNEGGGRPSRTVKPGARLAGGQVELRRIETTTAEPQVVLVQNGVEVFRSVGV